MYECPRFSGIVRQTIFISPRIKMWFTPQSAKRFSPHRSPWNFCFAKSP